MIYGEKVILGPVERYHLPIMVEYRNDPDLRKYFREYRLLSLENQTQWWEDKILKKDPSWIYFVIYPKDNSKHVIGMTGLTYMHPVYRNGEFAIVIGDKDYRRKGLGEDSLKALIRYGFNDLNLHRIDCEVFANNTSIVLYRKLGFVDEGTLRDRYYWDGNFWDSYILSLLRHEFDKQQWSRERFGKEL